MSEEQEPRIIHIPAASERCTELFKVTDQYIDFLYKTAHHPSIAEPKSNIDFVKLATLFKVNGLVVSINLLLRHDHWEEAKILNRSLFELLLHTEEIFRREREVEGKVEKFLLFNELQDYRKTRAEIEYNLKTNRFLNPEYVKQTITTMDTIAKKQFGMFLKTNKYNETYWEQYWTGKKPRKLAYQSKNSLRKSQYDILYPDMSNFVHCSPSSIMSAMNDIDIPLKESIENEGKEIVNQAVLMITFAQEILILVSDVCPSFDTKEFLSISNKVKKMVHEDIDDTNRD